MLNRMFLVALVVLSVACTKTETTTITSTAPPTDTTPAPPPRPTELVDGFQTPESVLYDAEQDVYFVSNINGQPLDVDDNGYISRVNAETLQSDAKWIDGAKPEITLNAPKGLAIVGDELWASDITSVRKFDRKTGAPKGEIVIKGSTFLNDLAIDGATVYVTDTGVNAKFAPTGTDAVYKIENDKPTKLASGKDLKRPNGVTVAGGKVWVASFGANEVYPIENGRKGKVTTLPKGGLDGLLALEDGSLLVSSWDAKAVYRVKKENPTQVPIGTPIAVVENVDSPADMGYDTKRRLLLVPHFMENKVSLHDVQ